VLATNRSCTYFVVVVVVVVVVEKEMLPGFEDPTADPLQRFYSSAMSH
jgi:hypothetical protein